uniref:Uncharacterized protein n=1 Tax=Cacopsylla melanoneura TaxID=428564 RepID=A0A8D8MEE4_9HEMI
MKAKSNYCHLVTSSKPHRYTHILNAMSTMSIVTNMNNTIFTYFLFVIFFVFFLVKIMIWINCCIVTEEMCTCYNLDNITKQSLKNKIQVIREGKMWGWASGSYFE